MFVYRYRVAYPLCVIRVRIFEIACRKPPLSNRVHRKYFHFLGVCFFNNVLGVLWIRYIYIYILLLSTHTKETHIFVFFRIDALRSSASRVDAGF